MTAADILRGARALIATGWTQGAWARDRDDKVVHPRDGDACCWCLDGAIVAVSDVPLGESGLAFEALANIQPLPMIWNDQPGRRQSEVLALFDRAIAALSSEGTQ